MHSEQRRGDARYAMALTKTGGTCAARPLPRHGFFCFIMVESLPHGGCSSSPNVASELGSFDATGLSRLTTFISDMGGNPYEVLRQCGIDARLFASSVDQAFKRELPMSQGAALLAHTARHLRCPALGLLLGMHLEHALLGPVALLMLHAPTVEIACDHLKRFLHLRAIGVRVNVGIDRGAARFDFELQTPYGSDGDYLHDLSMASFVSFMKLACGSKWRPDAVSLARARPEQDEPWRELFGPMVSYGHATSSALFPAHWLAHPVISANAEIEQAMKDCVLRLEEQHQGDAVAQIRRVLPTMLPTGGFTIERVAELFGMHRRTLHRRLASQGLTFEKLLDEARFDIAQRALRYTAQPVSEVAAMLGYRDVSAFSRAFRRWTGQVPSAWRQQRAGDVAT